MKQGARVERAWSAHGLECAALAHTAGHRCGYVRVPEGHPWFGLGYNDEAPNPAPLPDDATVDDYGLGASIAVLSGTVTDFSKRIEGQVQVHGGVTFAASSVHDDLPEGWWFGFDCAHSGDKKDPSLMDADALVLHVECEAHYPDPGVIRGLDFVVAECERMAKQIAEAS